MRNDVGVQIFVKTLTVRSSCLGCWMCLVGHRPWRSSAVIGGGSWQRMCMWAHKTLVNLPATGRELPMVFSFLRKFVTSPIGGFSGGRGPGAGGRLYFKDRGVRAASRFVDLVVPADRLRTQVRHLGVWQHKTLAKSLRRKFAFLRFSPMAGGRLPAAAWTFITGSTEAAGLRWDVDH